MYFLIHLATQILAGKEKFYLVASRGTLQAQLQLESGALDTGDSSQESFTGFNDDEIMG